MVRRPQRSVLLRATANAIVCTSQRTLTKQLVQVLTMAVVAPAPIAVTDFATFGARLNAQIGIGSDTELVATIGRKLPAAGV